MGGRLRPFDGGVANEIEIKPTGRRDTGSAPQAVALIMAILRALRRKVASVFSESCGGNRRAGSERGGRSLGLSRFGKLLEASPPRSVLLGCGKRSLRYFPVLTEGRAKCYVRSWRELEL